MSFFHIDPWQAYDVSGHRKYLTADERQRFLAQADRLPADRRALCYLLAYSGCRISEALAIGTHNIDGARSTVTFRTLKRRRPIFRTVPVPRSVAEMLLSAPRASGDRLWRIHRVTAWRTVTAAMEAASVRGPMRCCKGLRHGYGVQAAGNGIPLTLLQKWLGHASLTTTAIYLDVVGEEERRFADRMWD